MNLSIVFSFFAIVLSLINLVIKIKEIYPKLSLDHFSTFYATNGIYKIIPLIANKSAQPMTITNLTIIDDKAQEHTPSFGKFRSHTSISTKVSYTSNFPVPIGPWGATKLLVEFKDFSNVKPKYLKIVTTRKIFILKINNVQELTPEQLTRIEN